MERNYKVREFHPDDFDFLMELWKLTDMGGPERGDTLPVIQNSIRQGGKLLVLEVDEKLVGSSWMTQDGRRVYLHHFSIHPDYQGMGLSHMLMNTSLTFIRELGLQVKLEVHHSNKVAIDLYLKYGFDLLQGYEVYIIRDLGT